jgi:hypothetical protein
MLAGMLAVFVTENEAGTVALLFTGLLLLLPALAGAMPRRIVWGDKEIDWGPLEDFLQDVFADADEQQRAALTGDEGSERLPPPARSVVSDAMLRAVTYEESVASAAPQEATVQLAGRTRDAGFDFLLSSPSGKHLAVEVKAYSRPLPASAARLVLGALRRPTTMPTIDEFLLVSATEPTSSAREMLSDAGVHIVVLPDPSEPQVLTRKMADLLGIQDD